MRTLDEEIAWWERRARETESDAALIAFGVVLGLKLAKEDYGASEREIDKQRAWGHGFIYGVVSGAMVMGLMFLAWLVTA